MRKQCLVCTTMRDTPELVATPLVPDGYWPICLPCINRVKLTDTKTCLVCTLMLPTAHFHPAHSSPDHFMDICHTCSQSIHDNRHKVCNSCLRVQDFTAFATVPGKDGVRRSTCVTCIAAFQARQQKPCAVCHRWLHLAEFALTSSSFDGHRHTCITCVNGTKVSSMPANTSAATSVPAVKDWTAWARNIHASADWIILDTETTGIDAKARITEISAITMDGTVVIDQLVNPEQPIPYMITEKTGITDEMVRYKPTFTHLYPQLQPILASYKIVAYNSPFDIRLLQQNILRCINTPWEPMDSTCLMRAFSSYYTQRYTTPGTNRWMKLTEACRIMNVVPDVAHRALGDCRSSLKLLQAMAYG